MAPQRRRHLLLLLLLAAAAYVPSLEGDFLLWDDAEFVQGNPLVRPLDGETIRAIFDPARIGAVEGIYIPLTDLSLALDRTLSDGVPRIHHITNLALHVLATLLLYFCFLRLPLSAWGAFVAAAVFALHPVHVESVAWLSCRKDVLSMAFFAGALLCGMEAALVDRRRAAWAAGATLLFACAVLAKPTTVVLPVLLLIWASSRGRTRASLAAALPLLLAAAGGVALQVWMGRNHGVVRGEVVSGLGGRLLEMARVFPRYLWNLAFPTALSARYDWSSFGKGFDGPTIGALEICVAYILATFVAVRRAPRLCLALLWVLVALAPVAQIVPTGLYMADKYLHLPSIGFCLLVALWVEEGKPARVWASAVLLGILGALTYVRCDAWHDTRRLMTDAMAQSPGSVDVDHYLGRAFLAAGDLDRAERALHRAVDDAPGFYGTYFTLAMLELGRHRPEAAEADLARCLALHPRDDQAMYILHTLRIDQERDAEAEALLRSAIGIAPLKGRYAAALVQFLRNRGRREEALAAAVEAHDRGVRSPDLALEEGITCILLRRLDDAEQAFREGIEANPFIPELHYNLAYLLIERKAYGEAREHVLAGLHPAPLDPRLREQLGLIDFREGRFADAIGELRQALNVNPRQTNARVLLARSYEGAGQRENALATWKKLLEQAPDHAEAKLRIEALEKK